VRGVKEDGAGNDGFCAVWEWGPSISQSFRIGPDHLPVWSWQNVQAELELYRAQLQGIDVDDLDLPWSTRVEEVAKRAERRVWDAKFRAKGSSLEAWMAKAVRKLRSGLGQGTYDIIEHMADVSNYTTHFGKDDPDFAMTLLWFLTPFTDSQTEFSFWTLWGGNLLFATDPRNMTAQKQSIILNTEAIAVHQDPKAAAGTRVRASNSTGELWARTLSGGDRAVILFNPSDSANLTASLTWSELGLSTPSRVRDLWLHQDLPPAPTGFARTLVPHQVAYLRVTP
jgi:hypothetical protein